MRLKGSFQYINLGQKLLLFLGISLFSVFLFSLLVLWFANGNVESIQSLKLAQLLQSVGLFIVPPFVLAYLWSEQPLQYLHLKRTPFIEDIAFAILIMFASVPAINLLSEINHTIPFPEALSSLESYLKGLENRAEELTMRMLKVDSVTGLFINIGLIALIPAIGEELFFRGIIQKLLQTKFHTATAVWVTAIIFSAVHMQFYGFIPRVLMGALLGYLFVWTGNLWIPVIAHFVNNATAVIFHYVRGDAQTAILDLEEIGKSDTYMIGIVSIVIVTMMLFYYVKRKRILKEKSRILF